MVDTRDYQNLEDRRDEVEVRVEASTGGEEGEDRVDQNVEAVVVVILTRRARQGSWSADKSSRLHYSISVTKPLTCSAAWEYTSVDIRTSESRNPRRYAALVAGEQAWRNVGSMVR